MNINILLSFNKLPNFHTINTFWMGCYASKHKAEVKINKMVLIGCSYQGYLIEYITNEKSRFNPAIGCDSKAGGPDRISVWVAKWTESIHIM